MEPNGRPSVRTQAFREPAKPLEQALQAFPATQGPVQEDRHHEGNPGTQNHAVQQIHLPYPRLDPWSEGFNRSGWASVSTPTMS